MKNTICGLLIVCCASILVGCGRTGPLYIPENPEPKAEVGVSILGVR